MRLSVTDFGCIGSASVEFGRGLNVLYGPNDLGKSTLAAALRAVLLLQPGSSGARAFMPWHGLRPPQAELVFVQGGRSWRVRKTWASAPAGRATLEWSNDGATWTMAEQGRGVDGELRSLLSWGVAPPGGRGGKHGVPRSFLSTVMMGEQARPYGVFDQGLDKDPFESGRERLTEALQTMAHDPLFRTVLEETQHRVDEAFTATGRRRRGKTTPFFQTLNEIKRLSANVEELDRRVAASEAVATRLAELDTERDQLLSACAQAKDDVDRLSRALLETKRRREVAAALQAATRTVDDITHTHLEIERLQREQLELDGSVAAAESTLQAARQAEVVAQKKRTEAEARHAATQDDGVGDVQRKLQGLTAQNHAVSAQLAAAQEEQRAVVSALGQLEEAKLLVQAREQAAVRLNEAARAQAQADARRIEHQGEVQRAEARLEGKQLVVVRAQLDRANELHDQAQARLRQSSRLRAEADVVQRELDALRLPNAEQSQRLRELEGRLRLAQAKLGGGLSVEVELELPVAVQASIDGAKPQTQPAPIKLEAERSVDLELQGIAKVRVVGGEAAARADAEQCEAELQKAASRWFKRAGVSSWAGLFAAVEARKGRVEHVVQLRRQADELQQNAEAMVAAIEDRGRLQRNFDTRFVRFKGDLESLARDLEDVDEAELRRAQQAAHQQLAASIEALADASRRHTQRETEHASADQAAVVAKSASEQSTARWGAAWPAVADELAAKVVAFEQELAAVRAQLGAVQRDVEAVRENAQHGLAAAVASEAAAAAARAKAEGDVAVQTAKRAEVKGALSVRREQAAKMDLAAATATAQRLERELSELPIPEREVGAQEVQDVKARVEQLDAQLEDASGAVRKQEGALAQVGGDVVRERAEATREALEAARRHEAELELDYDAWQLLLEALRRAQEEEGRHLGDVLGEEVSRRFTALTRGRYGGVRLSADLEFAGLATDHGLQPMPGLSEGLKEQLATILRISVAQHLRGSVVLDDHLAQTDPGRIRWFRELLRAASREIQIVVLTCRPEDYLDVEGDDEPEFRAVDLERAIVRGQGSATTGSSPTVGSAT